MDSTPRNRSLTSAWWLALALVLATGMFLRFPRFAGFTGVGFDEDLYRRYAGFLGANGADSYADLIAQYRREQARIQTAMLPPTRVGYIAAGYAWQAVTGAEPHTALRLVSALFSTLTLPLAAGFALRTAGRGAALAITALMAVAPTQIHMAQHAFIDGVFAFWALLALWLLWESLRAPANRLLPLGYGIALALLVLTKESAPFVIGTIVILIALARRLGFGRPTGRLLVATVAGPAAAVVVLASLCGGFAELVETIRLFGARVPSMPYAQATGVGPWYRYVVELLLVSPVVTLAALGGLFRLQWGDGRNRTDRTAGPDGTNRAAVYMALFVAISYVFLCNLQFGLNLRYTNMWDFPLRFLAFTVFAAIAAAAGRRAGLVLVLLVVAACALEFRQYYILAVQFPLYDLVPESYLRATRILN